MTQLTITYNKSNVRVLVQYKIDVSYHQNVSSRSLEFLASVAVYSAISTIGCQP